VIDVRGRGLWAGVDLHADGPDAFAWCRRLLDAGLLCKNTQGHTLRFSPPLCITGEELDWALSRISGVLG
jgi:ornithine--oxo-acid transaminase